MTTKAQLTQATALNAELDQVNAALALVATGTFTVVVEIAGPAAAAMRFNANVPQATLTNLLTNRQTNLQSALTALGVS